MTFCPQKSAVLNRRCLQSILREKAQIRKNNLASEIQEVIELITDISSHLMDSIDSIRNIGNYAAHHNKSKITVEIVEVEFGEAELLFDVIEALFDFYFVQPKMIKEKR